MRITMIVGAHRVCEPAKRDARCHARCHARVQQRAFNDPRTDSPELPQKRVLARRLKRPASMKKNTNSKKLISVKPETVRLISDNNISTAAGGATWTQLYYSCRACGSTTNLG